MLKRFHLRRGICASDQIILQSGKRMVVENCKKVFYCDPEKIVLEGAVRLEVAGKNLRLFELGNGNMEIRGVIHTLLLGENKA